MRERSLQSEPASSTQDGEGARTTGVAAHDVWHGVSKRRQQRIALRALWPVLAGLLLLRVGGAGGGGARGGPRGREHRARDRRGDRGVRGRARRPGRGLLCGHLGAGAADRERRTGRYLRRRQRGMDGPRRGAGADPAGKPAGACRQSIGVRDGGGRHRAVRAIRVARSQGALLAAGGSRWATPTTCRPASTRARRWRRWASGGRRESASRLRPTCGRRSRSWRAAKRRSASSTRPTPCLFQTSAWSPRYPQRCTSRSSTRSPASPARESSLAARFFAYLTGPEGRAAFARAGFVVE